MQLRTIDIVKGLVSCIQFEHNYRRDQMSFNINNLNVYQLKHRIIHFSIVQES
jgi:hypothetical protein